jgi:hypothetical protein
MRPRNFLPPALALAGLILFFCLLTRLLLLRYEKGDIYPAYSTLRVDPLGARAYYEALASLPQYEAARGFKSLHRELEEKPGTLFYLGLESRDMSSFSKDEVAEIDDFVKNGGRVVLTFAPRSPGTSISDDSDKITKKKDDAAPTPSKGDTSKPDAHPPAPAPETKPDEDIAKSKTAEEKYEREEFRKEQEEEAKINPGHPNEAAEEKYQLSLAALWGFGWDVVKGAEKDKEAPDQKDSDTPPESETDKPEVLAQHVEDGSVEASVPWKSALYFVRLEPEWQQLYSAKDNPVLIRRKWGKGEIIVATDSYFISNEALRNNRRPALLGLLTGPPGNLLFDETHLGTQEQEGVMFLAEKFRLEGYLYGIIAVVLLFLWRNSAPLVPPRPAGNHAHLGGAVSGKDSRSGLVNLLRRNIAAADILKTGFAEWRRNVTPGRQHLHGKMAEMEAVLSSATGNRAETIVDSYHQLRKINTPRHAKGNHAAKS